MFKTELNAVKGEKDLLIAISNGDSHSFELIFKHYASSLGRYAYRVLEDKDVAEDLVQDVFINVWLNKEKLANVNSFKDYIFILSKNRILNELKKKAKNYLKNCTVESIIETIQEDGDIILEWKLEREQIYNQLNSAIEKLPAQQQRIIKLAKIEKKSYQQIAEILNISIETVRKHLFLAYKTLRVNMQSNHDKIIPIILFYNLF